MLTKLTALAFAVALLAGCGSNEQAPAPTFGSHEVDEFYVIHPPTGPSITVWCEGSAAFLMTDSGSLTVVDGRCDHGLPFPTAWNLWGE